MDCAINWRVLEFTEMTISQLYEILYLRSEIFVVEQSDIYLDPDCNDQKALHILGYVDDKIVAYCRVFRSGDFFDKSGSIGRVLVTQEYRSSGLGKALVSKALDILSDEKEVRIAAQIYLQSFYESFGFVTRGDSYLDGSIEHINMVKIIF